MARRRLLRPASLAGLALPLLLSACSGTPFGEALSRSFPAAPSADGTGTAATPSPPAPAQRAQPGAPPAPTAKTPARGKPAGAAGSVTAEAPAPARPPVAPAGSGSAPPSPPKDRARPPAPPMPYRVVLRLPEADPAAPAEVLTDALRAAGVPFEVETIERLGGASAGPAGQGPPAGTAGPEARPAPAPP